MSNDKQSNIRLRRAYEATVERAAEKGKSDFMCGTMMCGECPFGMFAGYCTDESLMYGSRR